MNRLPKVHKKTKQTTTKKISIDMSLHEHEDFNPLNISPL